MASYPKNFTFYTVPRSSTGTLTGNFSTLLGSTGSTLVSAGQSNVLDSGSGPATLMSASLAGVSTTLIGNGSSSLSGGVGNDFFKIPFAGDYIGGTRGGNDTLSTPINTIDLSDTLTFGSGITSVGNAFYSGLGGATLKGNGVRGSLLGGRTGSNSLIAGSASQTLVGGSTVAGGIQADTLVGNGKSLLIGGSGNNVYVLNAAGDTISQTSGSSIPSILTTLTGFNLTDTLHYGNGILNVKQLVFTNDTLSTGTVSLIGNSLSNTIVGATNAKNYLAAGSNSKASLMAGNANDTLVGNGFSTLNGGTGQNLYYVSGSSGGKTDVIINAGKGSSVIGLPQGNTPFVFDLSKANNSTLPGGVIRLSYTGAASATLVGNTLSGNTDINTMTGGSGTNVLISGLGGASMTGGNKGNFFTDVYSPSVISTMQGGGGNDTYYIANVSDLVIEPSGPYGGTDVVLTSLPYFNLGASNVAGGAGVENLTYFGSSNAEATLLGNSLNNSLDASSGSVTLGGITLSSGGGFDTLLGSAISPNAFLVSDPKYLGSNFKITGGAAPLGDTLFISSSSTLSDSIFGSNGFQFIQNVENLNLYSPSSATLGSNAAASGISKVILGLGPDTVIASGYNTLTGSTLADLTLDATANLSSGDLLKGSSQNGSAFLFSTSKALQASTLTGSSVLGSFGADTLAFIATNSPLTLGDGNFTSNITGIDILSVPGGSVVTLGINAQTSGISTIAAGAGNSTLSAAGFTSPITINVSAGVTDADSLVGSSVSGTRFVLSSPGVLSATSFLGGSAPDTLAFSSPVTLGDTSLGNATSIEILQLTSPSSVSVGAKFQAAGVTSVVTGLGPDTVDASAYTTGVTLDASANTSNADILIGSSTAGTSFLFSNAGAVATSAVTGGTGTDTLSLTAQTSLSDTVFNPSVTQIEVLALSGASAVTLDSGAASTGFLTVLGGNGNSSITQGAGNTLPLTLVGGSGNDLISIASPDLVTADSVFGNGGNDTLVIASASTSVTDSVFSKTKGIGTLQLTSPTAATLGVAAQAAGINSVVIGADSDSVNASSYTSSITLNATSSTSLGDTLLGSATASNTFIYSSATALAASSIKGGAASDSLSLSGATNLPDSVFGKVSFVDVLISSGASSVTLDSLGASSGITTVILGDTLAGSTLSYSSTLSQTSNNTLSGSVPVALTVIGGIGNDSILVNNTTLLAADSISGGGGVDTLALATPATLDDSLFGRVSGTEALSLSGISSLSLGSLIAGAGIKTIYTTGNSTLAETSLYSGAATFVGGAGNDLFQLTGRSRLLVDSLSGGSGIDTLQLQSPVTLSDSDFARITGVERLQLTSSSQATLGAQAQGAGINYVSTGVGPDTINASGVNFPLTLDASSDTVSPLQLVGSGTAGTAFLLSGGNVLTASTVTGGTGSDTVALALGSTLADSSFGKLRNVEVLSLMGASSVTLSNQALSAGIKNVVFGSTLSSDNSTFTQLANNTAAVTVRGGSGNDLFNIANASIFTADLVSGGSGTDTIAVGSSSTLNDVFGRISGIEALSLTGASAVTLNSAASSAGIVSLYGGNGNSSYVVGGVGPANATLFGGTGNDLFVLSSSGQVSTSSLIGGIGNDTLAISSAGSYNDIFGRISGIEALSLSGASAVTLGSNALNAGISSVFGGIGNSTFFQNQYNSAPVALYGNSLNDLISLFGGGYLSTDTISGGLGTDTLALATASTLNDASFVNVSGTERLLLTSNSQLALGSFAQQAGVNYIYTGNGSDTINASGMGSALTIDGSANSSNPVALTGSGSGTNLFSLTGGSVLSVSTVSGGSANDTISLSQPSTLQDSSFASVSNVEVLSLSGASSAILGSNANASGINSILSGSGTGTLNAGLLSRSVTLDTRANSSNAMTLIGSATSASNILLANGTVLGLSSVTGGASQDTLALSAASTLPDSSFSKVSSLDVLITSGASSVTVDSLAALAGITTVILGDTLAGSTLTSNSTLSQTSNNTLAGASPVPLTVVGGAGNDSIFVNNATLLGADSIQGGVGTDTLSLGTASTIGDSLFARISGVEALSLTSSVVTLGASASSAGINTVYTTGNSTLTETSLYSGSATLVGGSGNDLFQLGGRSRLLTDSVSGGSGTDTLQLQSASTLSDSDFTRISGMERLQLTSSSRATLGPLAQGAGINYVYTGTGPDTINASGVTTSVTLDATANTANPLLLVGSNTVGTSFQLIGGNVLSASTLTGGNGTDTVALSLASSLADSSFANTRGIDILSLSGASSVTLGNQALTAGINSVVFATTLSSDNSSFTQLANNTTAVTVRGGSGNDLFNVANAAILTGDSITGGSGADTIVIGASSTLNDAFSRVSGIEALSLTGASAVTLNSAAASAGIVSVAGGNGNSSYSLGGGASATTTISGGSGTDLFVLFTQAQIGTASLSGGLGTDTLAISSAGTFSDSFGRISGIEALSLTGSSAVTLGSNAVNAGIASVFGGVGNSTIVQGSSYTLAGGAPSPATLVGNVLNDLFSLAGGTFLSSDSIAGGLGTDTLQLATAATLSNAFAKISGIEVLSLNGASQVVLGLSGQAAGISSVIGGSATTSLDASAYTTTQVTLNNSASTVSSTLLGGTAADSLLGGNGIDSLRGYSGAATLNTANDTMRGGAGADLFIMAVAGDTNNAYGRGASNTAYVTDFTTGVGGDKIQLHQFGAGSADYTTLTSGSNLNIYHTATQTTANLVAVLTPTGTFDWTNNASFV